MTMGTVDRDVVVGLSQVHLAEDPGSSDVIGEGPQGWQRKTIKNSADVQKAEISTRPVLAVGFGLKM